MAIERGLSARGARPATSELPLADYDAVFDRHAIHHRQRIDSEIARNGPLYRRVLEGAFDVVPRQIRELHELGKDKRYSGIASVERGSRFLSRLVAWPFNKVVGTGRLIAGAIFTRWKSRRPRAFACSRVRAIVLGSVFSYYSGKPD